ncbi:MAG TPA: hypothetical protein VFI95_03035 [Terriglobales bacterium]|nr:hypothetical protein [Terriglobales bacterium]
MERLKIISLCILAAVTYGVAHDLVTTRVCLEYFTIFHPPVLHATHSPTLLALAWGVIATWWVGLLLGIPLSIVARSGSRPPLSAIDLAPMLGTLVLIMACCATIAGVIGYRWGIVPVFVAGILPRHVHHRFMADWWAHLASYGSGLMGGIALSAIAYSKRRRIPIV